MSSRLIRPSRLHLAGVTLVEMLVAMAIMGILLTVLMNFFGQTSQVSSQSTTRAELQQEVLNSQQLIAGKLREAWYVYPHGSIIVLSASATSALTTNPITNSQTWTVGTNPMLAMILPPLSAGGPYRFLAYYPVLRSQWVAGAGAVDWQNPGADPGNTTAWVMAEYRADMPATFVPTYPLPAAPAVPQTGAANLLSDYLAPTNATGAPYAMFTVLPSTTGATVTGVEVRVAASRFSGGTTVRLPDATGSYLLAVYPANLGKFASP